MKKALLICLILFVYIRETSAQRSPNLPPVEEKPVPEKVSYFVKAGAGVSQMFAGNKNYTIEKSTWGFSPSVGVGFRRRISKRINLEFDVSALKMSSQITGLRYALLYRSHTLTDTLKRYNGSLDVDWLNYQVALKCRVQPKLALPVFLNAGIDFKGTIFNHTTGNETITQIGTTGFEYMRLTNPIITNREITYESGPYSSLILSVECAPFDRWPDRLFLELGINETIVFSDFKRLGQRFLFVALKYVI